jgi:hypothetical protein
LPDPAVEPLLSQYCVAAKASPAIPADTAAVSVARKAEPRIRLALREGGFFTRSA